MDDILQGALGDCYFLAGLAALTNQADRISSLLVTKEVNRAGIYQVQLFVNGLRTSIVVDDYVPVYKHNQRPAFCRSTNQEIWAIIFEKAWAKLHGSYTKASSGVPSFGMIHLTGVPAENFPHDATTVKTEKGNFKAIQIDSKELWETFTQAIKRNHYFIANGRSSEYFNN